jgi:hypothetical protein
MMWMRRSVGVLIGLLVFGVMMLSAGNAAAQNVEWTPATTWTDNTGKTGTFTSQEMSTMKFYLRARKQGDNQPRKYYAETKDGISTWSGDFASAFSSNGLAKPAEGEAWEFTVSQAFVNASGAELDSLESVVAKYTFPFAPSRTPGIPGTPVVTD